MDTKIVVILIVIALYFIFKKDKEGFYEYPELPNGGSGVCTNKPGANLLSNGNEFQCILNNYKDATGIREGRTDSACEWYSKGKYNITNAEVSAGSRKFFRDSLDHRYVYCLYDPNPINYSNTTQIKHNNGKCLQANTDGSVTYENCDDVGGQKLILRGDATLYTPRFDHCIGTDQWGRLRHSTDCGNHFFWFEDKNLKYYNKPGNWSACVNVRTDEGDNIAGASGQCDWHTVV